MLKNTLLVALAIVIIVIVWMFIKTKTPTPTAAGSNTEVPALSVADWSQGNKTAKVTVIEYGDFQCPACGAYHPLMQQLINEYGDRVLFAFRNFPLTSIHDSAQITAEAAEAAGAQGKYWQMHDWLYDNQLKWATVPLTAGTIIDAHAALMGLNMTQFKKDENSDAVKSKIAGDVAGANAAGVDHTPTFFVNLKQISNPQSLDEFKKVLNNALLVK